MVPLSVPVPGAVGSSAVRGGASPALQAAAPAAQATAAPRVPVPSAVSDISMGSRGGWIRFSGNLCWLESESTRMQLTALADKDGGRYCLCFIGIRRFDGVASGRTGEVREGSRVISVSSWFVAARGSSRGSWHIFDFFEKASGSYVFSKNDRN